VLGVALYLSDGFYNIPALQLTTAAYVLCVLAVALRKIEKIEEIARRITPLVLAAGLAFQLYRLGADAAYAWPIAGLAIAVAAALALKQSTLSVWWVTLGLVVALVVPHFLIGRWAIRGLANPDFDVYWCHMQSLEALLKGINPHTLTIAYIHPDELKYPASYVFDGRVHIGFPYPPLSLFMALPGYLVGGDYRYSGLAATTLAGALMVYARPSRLSFLAAAIFLSTPAMIPVLRMGWTEPYVVLLLAVTVFCACRAPRLFPWSLGLLIAVKQYAIFAAFGVFLLPTARQSVKDSAIIIGKALALATAITLPWMLWNVSGFLSDVVLLQFLLPFRMDALSYLVWLTYNTGRQPPAVIGFLMMLPAVLLMRWRGARSVAGFAAAVSFIFLSLFLFNKAAFINYYFFVIGALCCATALAGKSPSHRQDSAT
jgi:hypothetical protein